MSVAPVLATVWRGGVREAIIRGHVVVADAAGQVAGSAGDPAALVPLRSCVKPIQALPFVRTTLDAIGAGDGELAVACASHSGEDAHVATVRALLGRAGLDEQDLACGPQMPFDEATARRLVMAGEPPRRIHNNCSGKHAAMLATCVHEGWPVVGYIAPEHPCMRAVANALEEFLSIDLGAAPWGVDGCGVPTYGVPLQALARGFARADGDLGFQRCEAAMAAHPHLVAGTGRFDTALLEVTGATLTAKIGGAALWAAVVRGGGPGIAIKLEAGAGDAIPPVALAALQRLRVLPDPLPDELAPFGHPALRNWAGDVVGETRVEEGALSTLESDGHHRGGGL